MRKYRKIKVFFKTFMALLTVFCFFSLVGISYMNFVLPNNFNVISGEKLNINSEIPISATSFIGKNNEEKVLNANEKNYSVNLKALGIFPIKKVNVNVISKNEVAVLGSPFGVKIYTDGVMIVGIDSVATENGNVKPADDAGLKIGDLIISINGQNVYSNEDVAKIIESCSGNELELKIISENKSKTVKIIPVKCYQSGKFKTGLWVRDSSAGIGTLTFYSPALKTICGLGHGICDADTGVLLTLNSGELVKSEILEVEKGYANSPGELVGKFKEDTIAKLKINNETGVYGDCDIDYSKINLIDLAFKQEIMVGDAEILTTINGEIPKTYTCVIEKIAHNNSITKNMVIRITDDELIEKTGGIVQGM